MTIIAISRGTYAGSQAVAEAAAERLGYPCISREVLLDAAMGYGIPAEDLAAAMEKPPSFWERLVGERGHYLDCVRAALCERARGGGLVLHGHAGHLLLPGVSHVLRVRVIADLEYRIKLAREQHNYTRKQAVAAIEKVDRERKEWTRFLFGVDWDDASLYDLILNISRMSIAGAAEIVARAAELDDFQPTPASLRAMEDLSLASRISAALARDPRTMAADLKAIAYDGVVTITGTTWSEAAADAVHLVASQVEGVKEIRCEVGVVPPFYEPI